MESTYTNKKKDNYFSLLSTLFKASGLSFFLFSSFLGGIVVPLASIGIIIFFINSVSVEYFQFALLFNLLTGFLIVNFINFLFKKLSNRVLLIIILVFSILFYLGAYFIFSFLFSKWVAFLFSGLLIPQWILWQKYNQIAINYSYSKIEVLNQQTIIRTFEYSVIGIGVLLAVFLFVISPNTEFLFLYAAVPMVFLLIATLFFKFNTIVKNENEDDKVSIFNQLNKIRENKFASFAFISAFISFIIFLGVILLFFIAYKIHLPQFNSNIEFVGILGFNFLLASVLAFIVRIVSRRLINRIGIQLALFFNSVAVFIISLLLLLFSYGLGVSSFLALFFVSLLMVTESTFRVGIFNLAFSVLIKAIYEMKLVFVNQFLSLFLLLALIFYGLLTILIFPFFTTGENYWHFLMWTISIISVVHIFGLNKMYFSHKDELVRQAKNKKYFSIDEKDNDIYGVDILARRLYSEKIAEVKLSTIVLSEVNPKQVEPLIPVLFKHQNLVINKAILTNVDLSFNESLFQYIDELIVKGDSELDELVKKVKFNFELNIQNDNLSEYDYKLQIINKIRENPKMLSNRFILRLDDGDTLIIRSLIGVMSDTNNQMAIEYLSHWLTDENYTHYIADYLIKLGDDVLPLLDKYFFHAKINIELIIKIIEIYGKIGSSFSTDYLISHINFSNNYVQSMIIKTLIFMEFNPVAEQRNILVRKIYFIVQNTTWLLTYRENFIINPKTLAMIPAIDKELKLRFNSLFMILEILYSKEQIALVKSNLNSSNNIYASEILNSILDDDLKNIIMPLVENIPNYQKIRRLNMYFAVESIDVVGQLKEMIKASPLRLIDSTRAKAIEVLASLFRKTKFNKWQISYSNFKEIEWSEKSINSTLEDISISSIPDEVFLGLFHQSPLVYTTAATVLYNINPARTAYFLSNFDDDRVKLLKILENSKGQLDGTILEKLKYLKRINEFHNVSVEILIFLAYFVELEDIISGDTVSVIRNGQEDIIWIYRGILVIEDENLTYKKNDILISGLNVPIKKQLKVIKSGKLLRANRSKYFNTLAMHEDLIRNVFANQI